jgi:hypothetical protein
VSSALVLIVSGVLVMTGQGLSLAGNGSPLFSGWMLLGVGLVAAGAMRLASLHLRYK